MKPTWIKALALTMLLIQLGLLPALALAQAPHPQSPDVIHVVQPGETLFAIAQRYGTTVEVLVAANDIENPGLINPGQRLVVPLPSPTPTATPLPIGSRIHVVKPGETLFSIAQRYGVTVAVLSQANGIMDPVILGVGQQLIIPEDNFLPTATLLSASAALTVTLKPAPVIQGQTLVVEVAARRSLTVTGQVANRSLAFADEGGRRYALLGIPLWTSPGPHAVELTALDKSGHTTILTGTLPVVGGLFSRQDITLPADRLPLLKRDLNIFEDRRLTLLCGHFSPRRAWRGSFMVPIPHAPVISGFGGYRSYNGGLLRSRHAGLDLRGAAGTPVMAAAAGRVAWVGLLAIRGHTVIVDHGWGVYSLYCHLSRADVEADQAVKKGDVIGAVGNTGRSTGPHLHWEMRVGGVCVDPLQWTQQLIPG